MRWLLVLVLLIAVAPLRGQECPVAHSDGPLTNSISRELKGELTFHNDIRGWFELKLDHKVCGEDVIQLLPKFSDAEVAARRQLQRMQRLRGCRVTTKGVLGITGTGYFSAELYQQVASIEPVGECKLQSVFPDYSHAKPSKGIRSYVVSMRFHYGADEPVHAQIESHGRKLTPWQAYASYMLTGGFAFYAYCADGFHATSFEGTPEAKPWDIDGYIAMDPEAAAEKHVTHISLRYTCVVGKADD
ncbi:hypothetical protein ACFQBQ_06275 [Granulicella cerasi]|uniref:Uncharacterized protein n=1 Tax=Granulicella cerasi TaxID=741063 RepID=A0ABW1Z9T9_9BACT|nr:hypothetical protein [Granulicella cerasi]